MAEISDEEKYKRKQALLTRALAKADEMDRLDEGKAVGLSVQHRNQ